MYCPKCGNENKEDALFCNECGASLKLKEQRYCPHCSNESSSNAKFCDKCGFSLETSKFQESQEKPGEKIVEKIGELKKASEFNSPETLTENGIEFVLIPAGEFIMGSPEDEKDRYPSEGPSHKVMIKKSFYLSKFPITQKQWKAVMIDNPSSIKGDDFPVDTVSWDNAQDFVGKLNEMSGTVKYRLPSEAEWEYACRAGTATKYHFGDDESKLEDYAWYVGSSKDKFGTSKDQLHPVGQKKPNSWHLYDMHGNVCEWVQDRWHKDYNGAPSDGSAWIEGDSSNRVARGGGYRFGFYIESRCRSAYRQNHKSSYCNSSYGFRILRENNVEIKSGNAGIISESVINTKPERIIQTEPKTIAEKAPKAITELVPKNVTETNSMDCPKCSNKNPSNAKSCNKCGFSLEIQNSQELQKKLEKEKMEKDKDPGRKIKKNRTWVSTIILLVFFSIVIHSLFLAITTGNSSNTDVMYTQDPSEMVLKINDMPEGWHVQENPVIEGEGASSSFYKVAMITALVVNCEVTKYPSIDDAKSKYQTMYNEVTSTTSVKDNNIGQESYTKEDPTGLVETTVFRKGNVIAKIECFGEDSVDYAEIVEEKIDH